MKIVVACVMMMVNPQKANEHIAHKNNLTVNISNQSKLNLLTYPTNQKWICYTSNQSKINLLTYPTNQNWTVNISNQSKMNLLTYPTNQKWIC